MIFIHNNILSLRVQQVTMIALCLLFLPYKTVLAGTVREEAPILKFAQCTSRMLRSDDGGITYYSAVNVDADANNSNATNSGNDDGLFISDHDAGYDTVTGNHTHPYCPDGYYCDVSQFRQNDLLTNTTSDTGTSIISVSGFCLPCFGSSEYCSFSDGSTIFSNKSASSNSFEDVVELASFSECQAQCGIERNLCSSTEECTNGLFCAYESNNESGETTGEGYCHSCPQAFHLCDKIQIGGNNLTSDAIESCLSDCSVVCRNAGGLTITDSSIDTSTEIADVNGFHNSFHGSVTGPLIDCGLGLDPCEGANGKICLIERDRKSVV